MDNLITSARANYNLDNRSCTAAETSTVEALVTAISDAIRKWCRRDFTDETYDELYSGNGEKELLLRQYPIISISRVMTGLTTVVEISNTDGDTNQQARVAVTPTGLTLTRIASGVVSTNSSVLFATYKTLATVVAAVNALGNGWTARVRDSNYNNWPSDDLRSLQGGRNCADSAYAPLRSFTTELTDYEIDELRGILVCGTGETDESYFIGNTGGCWQTGINNYRVQYTAGYTTVPEPVQEACASWVADLFWRTKRDPSLSVQSLVGVVQQSWGTWGTERTRGDPPEFAKRLLLPYRKVVI
jgi:hypothetical protein